MQIGNYQLSLHVVTIGTYLEHSISQTVHTSSFMDFQSALPWFNDLNPFLSSLMRAITYFRNCTEKTKMGINDLVILSISKILMQIETHLGKDTDKGSVQFQKLPNIWATFVEIWSPIPLKNSPIWSHWRRATITAHFPTDHIVQECTINQGPYLRSMIMAFDISAASRRAWESNLWGRCVTSSGWCYKTFSAEI